MDDLFHIFRILFNILFCLCLLFYGQFGWASTLFIIIETGKMRGFPCIKPMVDSQPINIKNVHKISRCPAIETEENTMSTLSDTMMLTLFITLWSKCCVSGLRSCMKRIVISACSRRLQRAVAYLWACQ